MVEKYLSEGGKLESTCLLVCLPHVNQEIFHVTFHVLQFLTNQATQFISGGKGRCLCLASSVNVQQK